MVQATIQLFTATDSTFVGGTVSDIKGNFIIEAPSNGTYRLKISSVGYQTIEREVILRRYQNQDLGRLLMSPESILLKEAVVVGRAAQVVVRKDTLVFNPEAIRTPEGSAIEELAEGRFLRSAVDSAEKPAGEWNTAEIVCKGNFIQAYVNGVLMNEAHFDRSEGPIALQSEGGPLEIRNIYITPLKD